MVVMIWFILCVGWVMVRVLIGFLFFSVLRLVGSLCVVLVMIVIGVLMIIVLIVVVDEM